jgi:hypothetical protein
MNTSKFLGEMHSLQTVRTAHRVRGFWFLVALLCGVFGGALGGFAAQAQWTPLTSVNTLVANVSTEDAKSEVLPDGRTWLAYWTNVGGVQNYQFRAQLLDTAGIP